MTTTSFSHYGTWNSSTRAIPSLRFLEAYSQRVDAIEITGPFSAWYAQDAKFYNADGTIYNGGNQIWLWMDDLFQRFAAVNHDIKVIRLFKASARDAALERDASWITLETETAFYLKGLMDTEPPILVPRFLMFLVGNSDVEGEGTAGLQILTAKAWWDSSVLQQKMMERK